MKIELKKNKVILPAVFSAGTVLNLLDFADYRLYSFIVPASAIMLFSTLFLSFFRWKEARFIERIAIALMYSVTLIQVADQLLRRIPSILSGPPA
jgi:hypothetical protein